MYEILVSYSVYLFIFTLPCVLNFIQVISLLFLILMMEISSAFLITPSS